MKVSTVLDWGGEWGELKGQKRRMLAGVIDDCISALATAMSNPSPRWVG